MPTYQGPPPPKTCWVCHHTLNHPTGRGRKRRTCNDSCRNTGRKIKAALSTLPNPENAPEAVSVQSRPLPA